MFHQNDLPLVSKLKAAVRHAKTLCVIGSTNKQADLERTGGWVLSAHKRYGKEGHFQPYETGANPKLMLNAELKTDKLTLVKSQWFFSTNSKNVTVAKRGLHDPLRDKQFNLTPGLNDVIIGSFHAMIKRQGNCSTLACVVAKYLWEHPAGVTRIERISLAGMDHALLIINRKGDLTKPETWGDAYIIDAWYKNGIVFHAGEYQKQIAKIKKFIIQQREFRQKLGFKVSENFPDAVVLVKKYEFNPQKTVYPVYEPGKKIEDYYYPIDYRFGAKHLLNYHAYREQHQTLYRDCLQELKDLSARRLAK